MKKTLIKLSLTAESLRVLETHGIAGAVNTQQPSCPQTCGNIPATTAAAAAFASVPACCV